MPAIVSSSTYYYYYYRPLQFDRAEDFRPPARRPRRPRARTLSPETRRRPRRLVGILWVSRAKGASHGPLAR
jgi:hypothetical protein